MSAAAIPQTRRELARRIGGGLEVTLYWSPSDNSTSIEVVHPASSEAISFAVARELALDAFHHPFAHFPIVPDERLRAVECR